MKIHRVAALAMTALVVASTAGAESSPEDVKKADKLFRDGQRLVKAGNVHEACAAFTESQHLDPAIGTLLNLADCHAQEHKTATARIEFQEAAKLAAKSGQREREAFAQRQLEQLEEILSFVTVRFAEAGANADSVQIDGAPVDPATLATPMALDPGKHAIVFGAAGRIPRTVDVDVTLGPSTQVVDVPPLERVPVKAEAPPPMPGEATRGFPRKPVAIGLGGLGVVALGVGTYFGIVAAGKKSDAEPHCLGHYCDPDGLALHDDAHSAATVSTIAFGVGLVSLGVGAYLWFTAPRAKRTALFVSPAARGARVGIEW